VEEKGPVARAVDALKEAVDDEVASADEEATRSDPEELGAEIGEKSEVEDASLVALELSGLELKAEEELWTKMEVEVSSLEALDESGAEKVPVGDTLGW